MIAKANDGGDKPRLTTDIWRQVSVSDPSTVKDAPRGLKAICPQTQVKRATELWGPYGQRWGLRNLKYDTLECGGTVSMTLQAEFYYPGLDGVEASFPIADDMEFRKNNDTLKKLRTSCQSKALGLLGFNSDVYEGLFDDNKYVADLTKSNDLRKRIMDGFSGKLTAAEIDKRWLRVEELYDEGLLSDADVGEFRGLRDEAMERAAGREKKMLTAMLRDKCGCVEAEDFAAAVQYLTGDDDVHTPDQIATALAKLREYEAGGGDCSQILALAKKGVEA